MKPRIFFVTWEFPVPFKWRGGGIVSCWDGDILQLLQPSAVELLADSQSLLKHTRVWTTYSVTVYLYSIQLIAISEQIDIMNIK